MLVGRRPSRVPGATARRGRPVSLRSVVSTRGAGAVADAVRTKGALLEQQQPGVRGVRLRWPARCSHQQWVHPGFAMRGCVTVLAASRAAVYLPPNHLLLSPFPSSRCFSQCLAWLLIISHLHRFILIFQFSMQRSENKHVPD